MKSKKIVLAVFLWISAWFPSVVTAQTELIPPLPSAGLSTPVAQPTPAPYIDILNDKVKLDKGDRLSYRIVEERQPAQTIFVNDSGEVDIPLIGHLRASGKTCKQLADEIRPLLEKEYYYRATVIIGLETHSERSLGKVYVMGLVHVAGGLEIPAGETLTVSKTIARAQGFADYADKENVRLIRKTEQGKNEMIIVNVAEIIDKGLIDKDPAVGPNDTIIVPQIKRYHSKVYVMGRVNHPSGLDLDENERISVSKAIARAEGFNEFGDRERVKLLRKSVVIPWFAVEDLVNPFGLANKILSSPDPISKYLKSIFTPESLAILANPETTKQQQKFALIEELNKAIQGILLYDEKRFQDVNLSAAAKRLKAQNPKDEDLIRLNRMLLEDAYFSELAKNRPPEYQVFIVNVAEVLDKGLVDKDLLMEPNDLVIVPENKRTFAQVSVMGQVRYPQAVELLGGGNLSVSGVIAKAGGFAEFANKSKVRLLRKNPSESYLIAPSDIEKLDRLIKKLSQKKPDSLSRFLWEHFTNPTRVILTNPRSTPDQKRIALVKELNRIIKEGSIYTDARFVGVKLPSEITLAITAQSGSCLLTPNDFLDVSSFVTKLTLHADPLVLFLWNQFTEQERKVLENAAAGARQQESTMMDTLLTRINSTMKECSIYNPQVFDKVEISQETLALLTQNPQGDELVRLNRLLMEDACPQEIKKSAYNPHDKTILRLNRRLLEAAYPKEIVRHDEYQTIIVDMTRIIDKAELDKDPIIEPDDLIVVPERWINF